MWAMPSATFFLTFLRTLVAVFAMFCFLFLPAMAFARALAGPSVGAGALAAAGQPFAMTQTPIATQDPSGA